MKTFLIIITLFCFSIVLCFSQNKYIQEGSIGKVIEQSDTTKKDCFTYRPIEEWVGEKFIFLPASKRGKKYGYQSFKGGKGPYGSPTYEECVGRIGTIIKIEKSYGTVNKIIMKMDDNGKTYSADIYSETVADIAPIADIDSARSRWLGKTLWYKGTELVTYDSQTDEFNSTKLKKYSPVKVINIIAGWYNFTPVRFILQANSGAEGFTNVNLSGTNVSYILRDNSRFDKYFFEEDPRVTYEWSNNVWSAIEDEKVFIGMTSQQAEMSWGKPDSINKTIVGSGTDEQWVYNSGSYLYFENGILTAIQN